MKTLRMMDLTDPEVLALADLSMPSAQDRRLSELLEQRKNSALTQDDEREVSELMCAYQHGLIRKAQGWSEAVRRGLRPRLDS